MGRSFPEQQEGRRWSNHGGIAYLQCWEVKQVQNYSNAQHAGKVGIGHETVQSVNEDVPGACLF